MNIFRFIILCNIVVHGSTNDEIGSFMHVSDVYWKTIPDKDCIKHIDVCINNSFSKLLNKVSPRKPEFVLWSSAGGNYLGQIANQMKKIFKNITVLPSLPPIKVFANESDLSSYKKRSIYFRSWLDNKAYETFRKFGYYSRSLTETGNLVIIVLNTALFCKFNEISKLNDPGGQWTWLNRELLKARKNDKKVYFLLSATPETSNTVKGRMFTQKHNERYINVIQDFSDVIVGQFGGYEDRDNLLVFQDKKGKDCGWLIVSPSFNKSIRLYLYNTKTVQLLDYIQYYKNPGLEWEEEYRFTNTYSVSNISIASFQKIVTDMENADNLFARAGTLDIIDKYDATGLFQMIINAIGLAGELYGIFFSDYDYADIKDLHVNYPGNPVEMLYNNRCWYGWYEHYGDYWVRCRRECWCWFENSFNVAKYVECVTRYNAYLLW